MHIHHQVFVFDKFVFRLNKVANKSFPVLYQKYIYLEKIYHNYYFVCSRNHTLELAFVFGFAADRIRLSNESEQTTILEKAVTRTITQCYALEGSYPPDIAYLTTHYGLTYDPDQYLIDYQYIGSNLRPDVTIIKRN